MKELCVNVSDNSISNIYIENGLISKAGKLIKEKFNCKKIALVSDTNVYPIYGDIIKSQLENEGYEVFTYIFKAGEASKNTTELVKIVEFMAQSGLTREDIAVALGGGVCGDMVGFAAAVFLRGIKFVQIPTSLLAQVDSSVGGKTAVDLPQGKNLCGAFHQPSIVIIDPNVLSTLSEHFFSDGMGEVIKYGCIKSSSLFELLEELLLLLVIALAHGLGELLQGFLLLLVQIFGGFNVDGDILVAPPPAVDGGDALALQAEGGAGLGALRQGILHFAVDGGDLQLLDPAEQGAAPLAPLAAGGHVHGALLADVGAGHEGAALAGDDEGAQLGILLHLADELFQLRDHGGVQRIQRLGAVDGGDPDIAVLFIANGLIHIGMSSLIIFCSANCWRVIIQQFSYSKNHAIFPGVILSFSVRFFV